LLIWHKYATPPRVGKNSLKLVFRFQGRSRSSVLLPPESLQHLYGGKLKDVTDGRTDRRTHRRLHDS